MTGVDRESGRCRKTGAPAGVMKVLLREDTRLILVFLWYERWKKKRKESLRKKGKCLDCQSENTRPVFSFFYIYMRILCTSSSYFTSFNFPLVSLVNIHSFIFFLLFYAVSILVSFPVLFALSLRI